jgi:aquaporin NIP
MNSKYLAEFSGTFFLVLIGTGSIIIDQQYNHPLGTKGIAICFGVAVTSMIYIFGKKSGSHINPAVTIALSQSNGFTWKETLYYVLSQLGGAILASLLLFIIFPENKTLGGTIPSISPNQAFQLEFILSLDLMLTILFFTRGNKIFQLLAPVAIGATVGVESWLAGALTGASMNPARSIGPALVSMNLKYIWLYILAPITAMYVVVFAYERLDYFTKKLK